MMTPVELMPTEDERAAAREVALAFARDAEAEVALIGGDNVARPLPPGLQRMVRAVLDAVAAGQVITLAAEMRNGTASYTLAEAADRPAATDDYVARLLAEGRLVAVETPAGRRVTAESLAWCRAEHEARWAASVSVVQRLSEEEGAYGPR